MSFTFYRQFPFCVDSSDIELWDGATYNGVDPSNSSGTQTKVVGPGTDFPVAMALDEVIMLYWRTKYIKSSCSYSVEWYDSLGAPPEWIRSPGSDFDIVVLTSEFDSLLIDEGGKVCNFLQIYDNGSLTRTVTTLEKQERSLACVNSWILNTEVGTINGTPWFPTVYTTWKPEEIRFLSGEYYPKININSISNNFGITTEFNSKARKIDQGGGPEVPASFLGSSCFGKSLTIYGPPAPTLPPAAEGFSYLATIAASATIEAHAYFPYDPGDGLGPIVDTSTGAILRQL